MNRFSCYGRCVRFTRFAMAGPLLVVYSTVGCGGRTNSAATEPANDSGRLVACNDGTGRDICCPKDASAGVSCVIDGTACWTVCEHGYTSTLTCTDGKWIAGHGLFPCGDGGSAR